MIVNKNIRTMEINISDLSEDARIRFLQQLRELLDKYEFDWIVHGKVISVPILSIEMIEDYVDNPNKTTYMLEAFNDEDVEKLNDEKL